MSDFTCVRIAEILGISKRAVQRMAIKHGWQYINNTGLGGQTRVYYFNSLTKDQRHNFIGSLHAYHLEQSKIDNSKVYKFTPTFYQETQEYTKKLNRNNLDYDVNNHVFCGNTTGLVITTEFVKIGLVAMAFTYALQHNQTKSKAYEKFSELYNSKSLGICERVYKRVNRFCSASLLTWEDKYNISYTDKAGLQALNVEFYKQRFKQTCQELKVIYPKMTNSYFKQYLLNLYPKQYIPNPCTLSRFT